MLARARSRDIAAISAHKALLTIWSSTDRHFNPNPTAMLRSSPKYAAIAPNSTFARFSRTVSASGTDKVIDAELGSQQAKRSLDYFLTNPRVVADFSGPV